MADTSFLFNNKVPAGRPKSSGGGIGGAIGRTLGFDATPGFNVTNPFVKSSISTAPTASTTPSMEYMESIQDDNRLGPYDGSGYQGWDGGGPSYTMGVNDPATLVSYDQNIRQTQEAIDRLGSQLTSGNQTIDNSVAAALAQLGLGRDRANKTYKDTKLETGQEYVTGKNTVRTQAGASLNGLLRLLGSRGAGGGGVAKNVLPSAVARQATIQQGDLTNTWGKNNRGLDQAWGDYEVDYNNEVTGVEGQRKRQKEELSNSIEQNRASLLSSLAMLSGQKAAASGGNATSAAQPYLDQSNGILNSLANYTPSQIAFNSKSYTAPELSKYVAGGPGEVSLQGQTQGNDYTSPYLASLLGKRKEQQPLGA